MQNKKKEIDRVKFHNHSQIRLIFQFLVAIVRFCKCWIIQTNALMFFEFLTKNHNKIYRILLISKVDKIVVRFECTLETQIENIVYQKKIIIWKIHFINWKIQF